MPELPDVEGFRRVAQQAAGEKVQGVETIDTSVLHNTTRRRFESALVGNRLSGPSRLGKWLLLPVDGSTVAVHFGMTGLLEWRNDRDGRHPHDRVALAFNGRRVVYRDQRKLQGVWLARQRSELDDILEEQDGLHEALQRVLRASVRAERVPTTKGWLTSQRHAADPACPRCGRDLERTRVGGRSTWCCPGCQPPRPVGRRRDGTRWSPAR